MKFTPSYASSCTALCDSSISDFLSLICLRYSVPYSFFAAFTNIWRSNILSISRLERRPQLSMRNLKIRLPFFLVFNLECHWDSTVCVHLVSLRFIPSKIQSIEVEPRRDLIVTNWSQIAVIGLNQMVIIFYIRYLADC
jgi:hypothetical protein